MRTVGVTGTNGKTTTTTFVAAALSRLARPVARVTTVGFHLDDDEVIDLPASHEGFTALMKRAEAAGGTLAAIEYTSEALARGYARSWPAEVAVFTNLTHDHLDAHGSAEHYLASKAQLFMAIPEGGTAVLNAGDEASALLEEIVPAGRRIVRYSVPSRAIAEADLRATEVRLGWDGTRVSLSLFGAPAEISLRAIGDVYAENALAALAAAIAIGVSPGEAIDALAHATPPVGRFQVVAERPWVVVDYAHSPDALRRTLSAARSLCRAQLHVVFGAGGDRDRDKRESMGAAASIADRVILTTDNARSEDPAAIAAAIGRGIEPRVSSETILDRRAAITRAVTEAGREDVVVIAGKGHERTQIVGADVVAFDDASIARQASVSRRR